MQLDNFLKLALDDLFLFHLHSTRGSRIRVLNIALYLKALNLQMVNTVI